LGEDIMEPHNKIIQDSAKQVFKPIGLFQVGASRGWIDDNGWYLIQVEFQPSAYSKGAYLNIGVGFLWEKTKELDNTLGFDYGYRERSHVEYNGNDIDFSNKMLEYANYAKEQVLRYRAFSDLNHAKLQIEKEIKENPENRLFWEYYNLAMLCFLSSDFHKGKAHLEHFLKICKHDSHIDWHTELYCHLIDGPIRMCDNAETAKQLVLNMISSRRKLLRNKNSYKKLRIDEIYN